jgi:hypothetical protein
MKQRYWPMSVVICVLIAVAFVSLRPTEPPDSEPDSQENVPVENAVLDDAPDEDAAGEGAAEDQWAISAEPPKTEEEIARILKNVRASMAVHQNSSTYFGPIGKLFLQIDDPALIPVLSQQSDASDSWAVKMMCFYALSNMPGAATDEALRRSIRQVTPMYDLEEGELDEADAGYVGELGMDWYVREGYLMQVAKHLAERGKTEAVADFVQIWEARPLSLFGKAGLDGILRIDASDNEEEPYSREIIKSAVLACKDDAARPLLEAIAFDKSRKRHLRCGAMRALKHWGADAVDDVLREAATIQDEYVLESALSVGKDVAPERTRTVILKRLAKKDVKIFVTETLLKWLGLVGKKEDSPVAARYLDDERDGMRMTAARAIVRLGGELPEIVWSHPRKAEDFMHWRRSQKDPAYNRYERPHSQPRDPQDDDPPADPPVSAETVFLEKVGQRMKACYRRKYATAGAADALAFSQAKERAQKVIASDAGEAERVAAYHYLMLFDTYVAVRMRDEVDLKSWLQAMAKDIPAEAAAEVGRWYVGLNWHVFHPHDPTEAIKRLDVLIAQFPETSAGKYAMWRAAAACRAGGVARSQEARDRYTRALAAIDDPKLRKDCFEERALVDSQLSAWLDAAANFTALLKEFPEDHDVLEWRLRRAEYFRYAGKTEQAVEELRALAEGPRGEVRGEALRLLGLIKDAQP